MGTKCLNPGGPFRPLRGDRLGPENLWQGARIMNDQPNLLRVEATVEPGRNRQMVGRVRNHVVAIDIAEERGGDNTAPSPPEYLLLGLGGCVMNITRLIAGERGLGLEDFSISVCGSADITKAMGRPSNNRAGFLEIEISVKVPEKWTPKERDQVLQELRTRCPLCDTIGSQTALRLNLE
jgi:uncharacterized OsmC-like protein